MGAEKLEAITKLWSRLQSDIDLLRLVAKDATLDSKGFDSAFHIGRIESFCDSADGLMNERTEDVIEIEGYLNDAVGEDDSQAWRFGKGER